ncbi:hypothetical protein NPIL_631371 [Nephila pilipes]|uniref:Secreted protein n=1 Tax=Nephila pilipes TaxID=299642 RepID=A0A8X6T6I1_NEPPI|nr:hypothetical protein NPIL_631371 [Nephila pilipes]
MHCVPFRVLLFLTAVPSYPSAWLALLAFVQTSAAACGCRKEDRFGAGRVHYHGSHAPDVAVAGWFTALPRCRARTLKPELGSCLDYSGPRFYLPRKCVDAAAGEKNAWFAVQL